MGPDMRSIFHQDSGRLRSGWRLGLFLLLLLAAVSALILVLHTTGVAPRHDHAGAPQPFRRLLIVVAATGAVILVSAVLLWATERRHLSTLGLALRRNALPGALLGLLAGALPVALAVGALAGLGVASVRPAVSFAGWFTPAAAVALAVTALVSALEELLWRGYAFQLLIEGTGRWMAVLTTALLWALGHANNPGANVAGLGYLLLSGVLIAWVVIRTGSLWFAIGYHVAWNLTSAHIFGLITSGFDLAPSLLRTTLTGPASLSGGSFGFEASVATELLDVLCLAGALLLARHLPRLTEAIPYFERRATPPVEPAQGDRESAPPPHLIS